MNNKINAYFKTLLLILLINISLFSQISNIIPFDRVVDWTKSGLHNSPPLIQEVVQINNADSLVSFFENKDPNTMTLVELDSGIYTFSGALMIPSRTILKGKGSDKTIIDFAYDGGYGFKISPENVDTSSTSITNLNDLHREDTMVQVNDINGLSEGDLILMLFGSDSIHHFHGPNATPIPYYYCNGKDFIGQMNKIKNISGNMIELEDKCRLDYSKFDYGRIIFLTINPHISNVGIEDLKIISSNNLAHNYIGIDWAFNCWIKGVETYRPNNIHIAVYRSKDIEISGCYVHNSMSYGAHANGYGISVSFQSTDVLVENNSFRRLRAPMILSYGANGNVFSYNYADSSQDSYGNYYRSISLHGHYPFANLFEGNVVDYILIDAWWGPAGPYNTFFRNRTKLIQDNSPPEQQQIEGFCIWWYNEFTNEDNDAVTLNYTDGQNLVGNRCDYNSDHYFYASSKKMDSGYYFHPQIDQSLNYIVNNIQGDENGYISDYGDQTSEFIGNSYFYESKPNFMVVWPFDPNNYDQLPAYIRMFNPVKRTFNNVRYLSILNKSISNDNNLNGTLGFSIPEESIHFDTIPSGYHLQIPNRTVNSDIQTHNRILSGQVHLNWNSSPVLYRIFEHSVSIDGNVSSINANFDYQKTVTIKSGPEEFGQLKIQDPWLVQNKEDFTVIVDTIYQVFLNQNEKFLDGLPIYRVKAPRVLATQSDIYVFDHWESSGPNDAVFSADGEITTTDRETPVVFKNSNATVTAVYVSANQQGKTVNILPGETLEIPPGGNYDISNNNFKIIVNGNFNCIGTEENPIVFESQQPNWGGIEVSGQGRAILNHTSIKDAFIGLQVNADVTKTTEVKNSVFSNYGLNCINSYAPLEISGCIFSYTTLLATPAVKIIIDDENVEDYTIVSNTFVNTGGLRIEFSSSPGSTPDHNNIRVNNNIISNYAGNGYYGINVVGDLGSNSMRIGYNDIFGYNNNEFGEGAILTDNLFDDPQLVDPSNGDFHLSANSPCIDSGDPDLDDDGVIWETDPDDQDPDGTRMDIGAYYYDYPPSVPTGFTVTGSANSHPVLTWNPNPEPDLNHYNVYRKLSDTQSSFYLIATTTQNTYTDNQVIIASSGGKKILNPSACYEVSAVDNVDNESSQTFPRCKPYLPEKPVNQEELIPDRYALHPAYPNPFNPETTIDYDLPEDVHVSISIYDITGKLIGTLVDEYETAGYKTVIWDGYSNNGAPVSSGTYLIRIKAGNYSKIIKCVLLR